jgi:hypothetical protein
MLISMTQSLQPEYTLDFLNPEDTYSTDVMRSKLTRDVAATFKEVREEFVMAMHDLIPTRDDSMWKSFRRNSITHTASRVGKSPHYRDPSTRNLPHLESYLCRSSSMFVIIFRFSDPFSSLC